MLRQLLFAVAQLLDLILYLYILVLIARAVVSWVNADPRNPIVRFLHQVTEPVLRPVRRLLPRTGIDFSPVVVILGIYFLQWFLVPVVREAAFRLG